MTLALVQRLVGAFPTVGEDAIRRAMRHLAVADEVNAEGVGATTFAALLEGLAQDTPGTTVAIISGGNVDPAVLADIVGEVR